MRQLSFTKATKTLIALALFASLLSFAKFDHCRNTGWASPDANVHACYSDISSLFSARSLDTHQWAYSNGKESVEYPVITGAVMWMTSWLSPHGKNATRNYFDVNILLISFLFLATLLLVGKIKLQFAYLLAVSPAVIGSLFINWDLWGITTMILAIYLFDKKRYDWSGAILAISISTKFFPVLLLLLIAFILWRRDEIEAITKYFFISISIWLAINLPIILTTPQGWWHFYKLNLSRESDWGSLWYAMSLLGVHISRLNYITLLLFLAVVVVMSIFLFELQDTPRLADVSFLLMAGVLCVGKVYSPQYILWLVPLAVIALESKKELFAFWIWQCGEGIYHIAIWQHLALVSGSHFGLSDRAYAIATLLRIASCLYFMSVLARNRLAQRSPQAGDSHSRWTDFLFRTSSSYP